MNRTPWLEATVNGLNIAQKDARLNVSPLSHQATAHEAIEAIHTLRALLAEVPAAQQHIQGINRSDDENDQLPPVTYYTQGPLWTPMQMLMGPQGNCGFCGHYLRGRWVCAAFPQGIPDVIHWDNDSVHHDQPFDGDGGIRFETREPELWEGLRMK